MARHSPGAREAFRYLRAARVPATVTEGFHGAWRIERRPNPFGAPGGPIGWDSYTILSRHTFATLHRVDGECVMEDGRQELSRHLPIWLAAHGAVLVTGLGLGCVVRGLLAKAEVTQVDVVELDPDIIHAVSPSLPKDVRLTIHCDDALTWSPPAGTRWDFAWHDIWSNPDQGEPHLQVLHAALLLRYKPYVGCQGAWQFPREFKRRAARAGFPMIG